MIPTGNEVNFSLRPYTPPVGDAVNFTLQKYPLPAVLNPFLMAFQVRGKVGTPEMDDPLGVYGIYQTRHTKKGQVTLKLPFYTPTNPQTEIQQANRTKFADAVAGWMALTPEEKLSYTVRAKKIKLFGWNLFIREYFQSH